MVTITNLKLNQAAVVGQEMVLKVVFIHTEINLPPLHHSQTSHHSTWLISNIERLLLDTAQLERKLQNGAQ